MQIARIVIVVIVCCRHFSLSLLFVRFFVYFINYLKPNDKSFGSFLCKIIQRYNGTAFVYSVQLDRTINFVLVKNDGLMFGLMLK